MKMSTLKVSLSILVLTLLLFGCAAPKAPRILWPAPPETPRMEFIGVYYSQQQFDKSNATKSLEMLLGEPDAEKFYAPYGIVSNGKGVVYISDSGAENIRIFDFNNKTVEYLAKKPMGEVHSIALDGSGRLYVVVPQNHNVLVYGPDHAPLFHFGDKDLTKPSGIAVDNVRQRIYVAEILRGVIEVFDMTGKHLQTIGEPGPLPGMLAGPSGLTVDGDGNIWVAEVLNCRVQEFSPEGKSLKVFGHRSDQLDGFDMPRDLAIDSEGHLQIIDARKGGILTYTKDGTFLLYTGMGAQSGKALGFGMPTSISIDANDRIYVADLLNKRFSIWQYMNAEYLKQHPVTAEDMKYYTTPAARKGE